MLRHAYHWRVGDLDAPVYRYVANWGRPGDFGLIRLEGMHSVAAAWYRLFPDSEPGFGFVDAATLDAAFASALCMALPSRREGYGKVVIEAASRGVPSVVVKGPDNAATELVEEGQNGFVARSAEAGDLAAALVRVYEAGPELRRSTLEWFGRNAQRLSLDRRGGRQRAIKESDK